MIVNGCNATSYTSTVSYRYNCTDWLSIRVDGRKSAKAEGSASNYACHCEGEARGNLLRECANRYPVPGDSHGRLRSLGMTSEAFGFYSPAEKNPPGSRTSGGSAVAQQCCIWYNARSHGFYSPAEYNPTCSSLSGATRRVQQLASGDSPLSRTRSAGSLRRWRSR